MIKLMHGDCLERMKEIPDKSIDLILCDLPYGVTTNKVDVVIPFDKLWEQYKRIIKDNTAILLFSQGMFYVDLVSSNREMFKYDLVWDKELTSGFLNANKMPLRRHEQIAVFYSNQPTYNPQMVKGAINHYRKTTNEKLEVNRNYGDMKMVECKYDGMKYPTSILDFQKPHPSVSVHPTEKSVDLMSYLIKTYSNKGDLVLDNTMGSGTTGVACIECGRDFIGIEKDDEHFNTAKRRIRDAMPMFDRNLIID